LRIFFLPSELEEDNDELCIVASNFVTLYEENNVVARIQLVVIKFIHRVSVLFLSL